MFHLLVALKYYLESNYQSTIIDVSGARKLPQMNFWGTAIPCVSSGSRLLDGSTWQCGAHGTGCGVHGTGEGAIRCMEPSAFSYTQARTLTLAPGVLLDGWLPLAVVAPVALLEFWLRSMASR